MWWEKLWARFEQYRSAEALEEMDVTACKIKSSQCAGILRWVITLLMSGQTEKQATFSVRLRWQFDSAQMSSNDCHCRKLINGVLVYFNRNVPQLTTCLWHLSNHPQQKYWQREMGGTGATTEDIHALWDTSSRVWFTQTINTATTSARIHICLFSGSRLARLSLTHCETFPVLREAFTYQLRLNTRPFAEMGNAAEHKKTPLQWRASCVLLSIYYTNIVTRKGNKKKRVWCLVVFDLQNQKHF